MADDDAEAQLAEALRELEAEIEKNNELQARIDDLEEDAYGQADAGEAAQYRETIAERDETIEQLQEQLASLQDSGGGAQQELSDAQQQIQALREELEQNKVLLVREQNKVQALEATKDDLSQKLHAEQDKARRKVKAAQTSGKDAKSHRRELNRVLEENRELRGDIVDLESDRDKLIGAVEELHEEVTESRKKLVVTAFLKHAG